MFFVPRKPKKHGIYDVLFASGDKNHGIYNVFGPGQAKTLVFIYAVLSMLQEVLFPCKIVCLGSALGVRGGIT